MHPKNTMATIPAHKIIPPMNDAPSKCWPESPPVLGAAVVGFVGFAVVVGDVGATGVVTFFGVVEEWVVGAGVGPAVHVLL